MYKYLGWCSFFFDKKKKVYFGSEPALPIHDGSLYKAGSAALVIVMHPTSPSQVVIYRRL